MPIKRTVAERQGTEQEEGEREQEPIASPVSSNEENLLKCL